MDIYVKLSTQLWKMQVAGWKWPLQQKRLQWSSFKMVLEEFRVIVAFNRKKTVEKRGPRQRAVIGWILWETDTRTEICAGMQGEWLLERTYERA